jgi:hypothetical protein
MKVEIEIPDEDIKDAIITALEGGSNYWYYLPDLGVLPDKPNPKSEILVDYLFEYIDAEVEITDIETDDLLGYLSFNNIKRGLNLYIGEKKFDPAMDANDADILFQYIVMGELIYG